MPANQYKELIEPKPETSEKIPEPTEVRPSLEEEILELEKKLAEKKAEISKEKEAEKEPVKEKVETEIETEKVAPTPVPPPSPTQVRQQVKDLQSLDRQNQVKILSDLAFQKGLDFAIQVAKDLDNAYVLDEFHDTLVDELYKRLIQEDKLKQL